MKKLFGKSKSNSKMNKDEEVDKSNGEGLFSSMRIGDIGTVKNRIALSSMSRSRATEDGVVGKLHVEYYTQRSNAGLILTEGVQISPMAVGWWRAPKFFTKEQISAWKPVVKSVHDNNGIIVLQLWHLGRASHSDYLADLAKEAHVDKVLPVSASAIAIPGDDIHAPGFIKKPYEVPRALEIDEIPGVIDTFVAAAKAALYEVGFDGVEIQAANGFLIDCFLQSRSNTRTDVYGGSVENRVRILDELLAALIKDKVPASKIGVKFNPNGVANGVGSADNNETFAKAVEVAASHGIAYIHLVDGLAFGFHNLTPEPFSLKMAKKIIEKVQVGNVVTALMGNCGYTKETAEEKVLAGEADMIAFGRPYIANPDLAIRFQKNLPLADMPDFKYFYTEDPKDPRAGYTHWPAAE